MNRDVRCSLCQLRERAKGVLTETEATALRSCMAAAPVLAALPLRLGCGLARAGSFFVLHGLCGVKSFVEAVCPSASRPGGQDAGGKEMLLPRKDKP